MQLPRKVTEIAQHAYKIGDEERISRGRNDDALIAASIIFATRMAGAQRSFTEVCKVTRVSKSDLGRVFKQLKSAIDKTGTGPKGNTNTSDVVASLLGRFSNYLDLGVQILNSAKHVAPLAMRLPTIDGRTPGAIAAGVLFFTTTLMEKSTTSKDIAGISGVSESTIKMICKKVAEELDQVIKAEWKEQFPKGYKDVEILGSKNSRSASAAQASRAGTPALSGTNTPVPPPSKQ
jgi:transcription initiation factor TFIIB